MPPPVLVARHGVEGAPQEDALGFVRAPEYADSAMDPGRGYWELVDQEHEIERRQLLGEGVKGNFLPTVPAGPQVRDDDDRSFVDPLVAHARQGRSR